MSIDAPWHITSLVIYVRPSDLENSLLLLAKMENVEVHANDGNAKIVIILEGPSTQYLTERIEELRNLPGHLSVQVVYHEEDSQDMPDTIGTVKEYDPSDTLIPQNSHTTSSLRGSRNEA